MGPDGGGKEEVKSMLVGEGRGVRECSVKEGMFESRFRNAMRSDRGS